jgi:hypothetical protein
MDLRRRKKIKNLLTRRAPNLPQGEVTYSTGTSFNHMKLLDIFCHSADTVLTRALHKNILKRKFHVKVVGNAKSPAKRQAL